jgi:2-dehydro-3-deoxygalactonokinase
MKTEWIAADWGTSNLRAWVFGPEDTLITELGSPAGMGQLAPEEFEAALLELVETYLPEGQVTPVVACGMVGARQGWIEAPYQAVPCAPAAADQAIAAPCQDPRIDMRILPGVKQDEPADVMRGEETQIAGFLALNPRFDGVICLPGTHTKWAHVSAGEIVSFRTFMTGELFGLLSKRSVLRHGMSGKDWDEAAFAEAVSDVMTRPQALGAELFSLRAELLLHDLSGAKARARLSGLLVGLELAGARPYWLGQNVALIGDAALSALYAQGLDLQGVPAAITNTTQMTLAGLKAARKTLEGSET